MPDSTKPPAARQPARRHYGRWASAAGAGLLTGAALTGLHFLGDSYLRSASFNKALDERVSNYLNADAHFSELTGDCPSLRAGQLEAVAHSHGSAFSYLAAGEIDARLSLMPLILHHLFYLDNIEIEMLSISLGAEPAVPAQERPDSHGFAVGAINIHQLDIGASMDSPGSIVQGMQLAMKRNQQLWTLAGTGGAVQRAGFPPLSVEKVEGRVSEDSVLVQQAILHGASGAVLLNGNVQLAGDRTVALNGTVSALPSEFILPEDWRAQINGPVSGVFQVNGSLNDLGGLETSGHLTMEHGVAEALPILRKLAPFLGPLDQLREVNISNSSADFTAAGSEIHISNLLLESPGLCRIEGGLRISPSGEMNGEVEFGIVPPGGLAGETVDGILEQVFTEAHDGYRWTHVHVSGTTGFPSEDLSPRISAAAANAIKAKGNTALKGAVNFLGNLIND